jgi:hypothetical protein
MGAAQSTIDISIGTHLQGGGIVKIVQYGPATNGLLSHTFPVRIPKGTKLTSSVFYRKSGTRGADVSGMFSNEGVSLTVYYADNTSANTTVSESEFLNTNGLFKRTKATYELTKDAVKITFKITISFASSQTQSRTIEFCYPQLEIGDAATSWKPRPDDRYHYMATSQNSPVYIQPTDAIAPIFVDNTNDFWYKSIPHRASLLWSGLATGTSVQKAGRFPLTDIYNDTFYYEYFINSSKLRFRDRDNTTDYIRDFYLAFIDVDKAPTYEGTKYIIKDGFTIEAITYFSGYIWIVAKQLDLQGTTGHSFAGTTQYIKSVYIVDPKFPWPAPTYLQVLGGFQLPAGVPLSDTIINMEFRNDDRQHIYLSSATKAYTIRMYYDLFTIDRASRRLLMRDKYHDVGVY